MTALRNFVSAACASALLLLLLLLPRLVDSFDVNRKTLATADIVRRASFASLLVVTFEIEVKTAAVDSSLFPHKRQGPGCIDPAGQSARGSQAMHEVAPVVFTYVPTSQAVQLVPARAE